MLICSRCNKSYKRISIQHITTCNRTPLPSELAIILEDNTISLTELSIRHEVSINFIRHRLEGTVWTDERITERTKVIKAAKPKMNYQYASPSYSSNKCTVCSILVEEGREVCDWCIGEKVPLKDVREV